METLKQSEYLDIDIYNDEDDALELWQGKEGDSKTIHVQYENIPQLITELSKFIPPEVKESSNDELKNKIKELKKMELFHNHQYSQLLSKCAELEQRNLSLLFKQGEK